MMGDPYKGRLAGHALLREGRTELYRNGIGARDCSCGERCMCISTNDAKKWHRQHKADVLDKWVANGMDDRGNEVHL